MNFPVIHPRRTESGTSYRLNATLRWVLAIPQNVRMARDPTYPWLAYGAVKWLKTHLRANMVCWEWGSGRSTVFIASRVTSLVTIEHKNRWKKITTAALAERDISNVQLRHVPSSIQNAGKICNEGGEEYAEYADCILALPDESLDLVAVDGRARVRCVQNSMNKLRPGGWLLLDNSERARYSSCLELLSNWPQMIFSNGLQWTSIFQKPEK